MDEMRCRHLLEALIAFFEAGNKETDAAAQVILASDDEAGDYWRQEVERLQRSVDWTGLRAPEAELLASGLRQIQDALTGKMQVTDR